MTRPTKVTPEMLAAGVAVLEHIRTAGTLWTTDRGLRVLAKLTWEAMDAHRPSPEQGRDE